MNPPEFDLKAIFNEAIERPAGPERVAYLDQACEENEALRAQLETLLKAHDEAGGFLATVDHSPASTASHRPKAILEGPGTMVGPYKLLQQIGEGGMGVVFMAEQTQPVRRKVALKVIKPGMDTNQVVARFEAERQALAMMDHPNIARVLDVGATPTGRPFFVMELVKGVPITEYCDRNQLTPKERLELFMPVCRAIQHAHQKGIIHRDIKPSNVLVTLHDGLAVPKVIDFGVAKAVDQRLTERTMFTEFGAVIGTLEYMSPEQAEMGALDIDTRSDIYSLGVLLYELLTGSTPLERAKLRKAAFSEVLRRIREEEPAKPSTRLSESNEALPSISAQRKMEPARLTKLVKGDLDWIVMKSLEKDRTRRYETATGFVRDIQKYLDGDAVEACPPSVTYKFRKFARKHRAALATAGAFVFVLIAATAISLGLAYWATRERDRAVVAEKSAEDQKKRAQEREQMAIDAMKRYGDVIRGTPELKNNPSLAPLRAKLLKEPQAYFKALRDRLRADKETTSRSLALLASAGLLLGELMDEIGDKQDALHAYLESLAIFKHLVLENPSDTTFLIGLATCHYSVGHLQDQMGQYDNSLDSCENARIIYDRLVSETSLDTNLLSGLAETHIQIGNMQRKLGRNTETLASYEKSHQIYERLSRENPSVMEYRSGLASYYLSIGHIQRQIGALNESLASFERSMSLYEPLTHENPSVTSLQNNLAATYNNIGQLKHQSGRTDQALLAYEKALAIAERLARENPSVTEFQSSLAVNYQAIGDIKQRNGLTDDALALYKSALTIRERLVHDNPSVFEFQNAMASNHYYIGVLEQNAGRTAEALAAFEKSLPLQERLVREGPSNLNLPYDLTKTQINIGVLQNQMGRPAEALISYEKSLAILERLASERPEIPDFAHSIGGALHNMAKIDLIAGRFNEARTKLKRAIGWQRKALATDSDRPAFRQFLSNHLNALIFATARLGLANEADEARRELAELTVGNPSKETLEARLFDVQKGKPPKDEAERLRLAYLAYQKGLHVLAVRLSVEAFASDPKLTDSLEPRHRYNAACSASLAGCGQCKDDPSPDNATQFKLRAQALEWLKADLAMWSRVLDKAPSDVKAAVATAIQHWKVDTDLTGIRDEKELAKLPEAEREAFRQFWAEVDQLLTRASGGK